VILTNHGARHLDSVISPMEILPDVAAAVGDRLTIVIDSGFRRGSDVVKAMALGANAVAVGRAPLWGLAAGGEAGVAHALKLLQEETHRVLGQIGCASFDRLGPQFVKREPVPNGARA
jgi:(S)-mandelate dehydrogenase